MANGGKITYTIGFNTDMSGLKKVQSALKELQNIDIGKASIGYGKNSSELTKIKQEAREVEAALIKAFNPKLGTYDINVFTNTLQKSNIALKQMFAGWSQAGAAGTKATMSLINGLTNVNLQVQKTEGLTAKLTKALSNVFTYQLSTTAYRTVVGSLSSAVSYAKELDKSLNDIRIVTNKSADEMSKFSKQANQAAQALGVTTTDYTNASLIYFQQGLDPKTVEKYTEVTLKAMNVTGQSAAQVSEELTAVWNGYKVASDEAEAYIDKLAAVAATSASDLEELATAMSKVAATAATVGVNIDDLTAQISTIVSTTRQAPESVGTALKTIYARIGDLKVDGTTEDGVALGQVSTQMQALGVDILDVTGDMREMSDVISDVAEKWQNWTAAQKQAAAIAMAGKRQYTMLMSLFENWDMHEKEMDIAANSLGTLNEQQGIYMSSLEAAQKQVQAAKEELYGNLFNENALKTYYDLIQKIIKSFNNFFKSIGGVEGVLNNVKTVAFVLISELLNKGIRNAITSISIYRNNVQQLQSALANVKFVSNIMGGDKADADRLINLRKTFLTGVQKGTVSQEQFDYIKEMSNEYEEVVKVVDEINTRQQTYISSLKEILQLQQQYKNEISVDKKQIFATDKSGEKVDIGSQIFDIFSVDTSKGNAEQILAEQFDKLKEQFNPEDIKQAVEIYIQTILDGFDKLEESTQEKLNATKKNIQSLEEELQEAKNIQTKTGSKKFTGNQGRLTISQIASNYDTYKAGKTKPQKFETWVKRQGFDKEEIDRIIENYTKYQKAIVQIESKTQEVHNQISQEEQALNGVSNAAQQTVSSTEAMTESNQFYADSAARTNEEVDKTREKIDALTHQQELANKIQTVAKTFQNFAMSMQMAENAGRTLGDENSNLTTKLVSLSMLGGTLVNSFTTIGSAFNKLKGHWVAGWKAMAAAEKTSVIGAIISLALTAIQLVKGIFDGEAQAQKEAAEKEAEVLQGQIDDRKALLDTLKEEKSALDNLQNSVKDLANTYDTQGIEAYRKALYELFIQTGRTDEALASLTVTSTEQGEALLQESQRMANQKLLEQSADTLSTIEENIKTSDKDKIIIDNLIEGLTLEDKEQFNAMMGLIGKGTHHAIESVNVLDDPLNLKSKFDAGTFVRNKKQIEASIDYFLEVAQEAKKAGEDDRYKTASNIAQKMQKLLTDENVQLAEETYNEITKLKIEAAAESVGTIKTTDELESLEKQIYEEIRDRVSSDEEAWDLIKEYFVGYSRDIAELQSALDVKDYFKEAGFDEDNLNQVFNNIDKQTLTFVTNQKNILATYTKNTNKSLSQVIDDFDYLRDFLSEQTLTSALMTQLKSEEGITDEFLDELYEKNADAAGVLGDKESVKQLTDPQRKSSILGIIASNYDALNDKAEEAVKNLTEKQGLISKDLRKAQQEYIDELSNVFDVQDGRIEDQFTEKEITDFSKIFGKVFNAENVIEEFDKYHSGEIVDAEAKTWFENVFKSFSTSYAYADDEESIKELKSLLQNVKNLEAAYGDYNKRIKDAEAGILSWDEALEIQNNLIQEAQKDLTNLKNNYKSLTGFVKDYAETGIVTFENLNDLMSIDPDYIGALEKTEDGYRINEEAIKSLTRVKLQQLAIDKMQQEQELISKLLSEDYRNTLENKAKAWKYEGIYALSAAAATHEFVLQTIEAADVSENAKEYLYSLAGGYGAILESFGESFSLLDTNLEAFYGTSSSTSTKTKKSWHEVYDVFHDINIELSKIEKRLKNLQKESEKLTGQNLVNNLKEQNKLLKEQSILLDEKMQKNRQESADLVASLGRYGATFNEEGNITNYTEFVKKNYQSDDWDGLKNWLDELEKLNEDRYSLAEQILDTTNSQISNDIKAFQVGIEKALEKIDTKEAYNNFQKAMIDEDMFDIKIGLDIEDVKNVQDKMDILNDKAKKVAEEVVKIQTTGWSEIYGDDYAKAWDELKKANQDLISGAEDYKEAIKQVNDDYNSLIDKTKNTFDEQISNFERIDKILNHDIKLIELINGKNTATDKTRFYGQIVDNDKQLAAQAKAEAAYWKQQMEAAAQDSEQYDIFRKNYEDSIDKSREYLAKAVEDIHSKYSNLIDSYFEEFYKKFAGMSLDDLTTEWTLSNKVSDMYLDNINKAFSIQDLQYKYQKKIDALTGESQAKMRQYMKEQIQYLEEKDKLTQYDVDRAQKIYDIHVAEMALEDARNNKSRMNLVRDSQGNYSYQYTADASNVADAEAELARKRNELYNFDKDAYRNNLQQIIDILREGQEAAKKVYEETGSAEMAQKVLDGYKTIANGLVTENDTILTNLMQSSATKSGEISDTFKQHTDNAVQAMIEKLQGEEGGLESVFIKVTDNIVEAFDNSEVEIKEACDAAGVDFNNLVETGLDPLVDETKKTTEATQALIKKYQDMMTVTGTYIKELGKVTSAYEGQWKTIKTTIDYTKDLILKQDEAYVNNTKLKTSLEGLAGAYRNLENAKDSGKTPTSSDKLNLSDMKFKSISGMSVVDATKAYNNLVKNGVTTSNAQQAGNYLKTIGFNDTKILQTLESANPKIAEQPVTKSLTTHYTGYTGGSTAGMPTNIPKQPVTNVSTPSTPVYVVKHPLFNAYYLSLNKENPDGWQLLQRKGANENLIKNKTGEYASTEAGIKEIFENYYKIQNPELELQSELIRATKLKTKGLTLYDTGGYTGNWNSSEGRLAMLHEKELVLNKQDTKNILLATEAMRAAMSKVGAMSFGSIQAATPITNNSTSNTANNNITINADFPNVTSHTEIEQAFNNLRNYAAQQISIREI